MNSDELKSTQEFIETILIEKIKQPIKNWTLINKYTSVLKDIDSERREKWNHEKFGVYEEIAEETLNNYTIESDTNFTMDDIPF